MLLIAEEAAPTWVPAVALLVPILILAAVGTWAVKLRRRASKSRRAQGRRIPEDATELGSAATIEDPSGYSLEAVLKAMAIQPEDHRPTADGLPHDEGWAGTMLGLRSRVASSTQVLEPHVFWGKRAAGQAFIRIGPDEKLEGGTTMFSNRHVRDITVLRVAAPVFDGTIGGWPYDLWLSEWLARSLRLPPLEDARIGPSWTVPYGFGKSPQPEDR